MQTQFKLGDKVIWQGAIGKVVEIKDFMNRNGLFKVHFREERVIVSLDGHKTWFFRTKDEFPNWKSWVWRALGVKRTGAAGGYQVTAYYFNGIYLVWEINYDIRQKVE